MITQNTPEWLEFRKNKVGASDAPVIMKKSPWKTPYQLWREKLSLVESGPINPSMRRGNELEPIARQTLEQKLGMPLQSKIKLSNKRSWMMASVDAISFDERTVAEIKCPGNEDHGLALSGLVPEKYIPQLQHQMEVCGVDRVLYFSFQETSNALIEVYRDDKYIQSLLIEEEKFFDCMMNFEAPELMDKDYVYQGTAQWQKLVERYREIEALESEKESIRKKLIEIADGKNSMGAGIKLTKCVRQGSLDYKKIPELQGIDLNPYRKKSVDYWRIS